MDVKQIPEWRDPVLVAAFGGWGDASSVATTAATYLMQRRQVSTAVEFDPEDHYVLTETRPHVRIKEGGQRRIQWPSLALMSGQGKNEGERDVVALLGPEPQLRWRTFSRQVAEFWKEHGKGGPAVLLGAFLAGVSHAAPTILTGFATTPELRERLETMGIQPSGYQGPTGIHSALAEAFAEAGVPCVSIWAACPHYLAAMPNPKACADQLKALDRFVGLGIDLSEMVEAGATFEKQVGIALAKSGQNVPIGQQTVEPEKAATPDAPAEPLPPAEELLKGVEEFLRQRKGD
jgi:PAC2 family